ncbi:MAG TPA: hypothetical protein VES38_06620 [Methylotenera sp.]|nr:hypothetical protein [Methylotenera sp.]
MKERPILFSAPMVRALLNGSKTQTRRVIKPQPTITEGGGLTWKNACYGINTDGTPYTRAFIKHHSPYGQIGDQLWVKETWRTWASLDDVKPSLLENGIIRDYAAGGNSVGAGLVCDVSKKWRSPLFMQKRFSRITLEITGIRVERLNDCSEEDAIAEGVTFEPTHARHQERMARIAYEKLWESINGAGSWAANPWVWVVEFKVVKP